MSEYEKVYVKQKNGRYKHIGYDHIPPLQPGLWLITGDEEGHSRSYSNAFYRMKDVPDMIEVEDMLKCMVLEDIITKAIVKWSDDCVSMSPADMAQYITTEVYKKIQEDKAQIKKLDKYLKD